MLALKRVVNRSAVRAAFHREGVRVPRGFMDELEQTVYVTLRRGAAGQIKPEISVDNVPVAQRDTPLKEETEKRIEAGREKYFRNGPGYLKESLVRQALREAFGKKRIETVWVAYLTAVIGSKVSETANRRGAKANGVSPLSGIPVPGRIVGAFLKTKECRSRKMTLTDFFRNWQRLEFRQEWITRTKYRGEFLKRIER